MDDGVEHLGGEFSRKGVLLARVVRANDEPAVAQGNLYAVPKEGRLRRPERDCTRAVAKGAEGENGPHRWQQVQLPLEVWEASVTLLRGRPVLRGSALDGRRHPNADRPQAVVLRHALGLACQTGPTRAAHIQSPERSPVSTASGPVAAVRRRRQTHHGQTGRMVTETRDGTSPVLLGRIGGSTFQRHGFPPGDQPRAPPAGHYLPAESSSSWSWPWTLPGRG